MEHLCLVLDKEKDTHIIGGVDYSDNCSNSQNFEFFANSQMEVSTQFEQRQSEPSNAAAASLYMNEILQPLQGIMPCMDNTPRNFDPFEPKLHNYDAEFTAFDYFSGKEPFDKSCNSPSAFIVPQIDTFNPKLSTEINEWLTIATSHIFTEATLSNGFDQHYENMLVQNENLICLDQSSSIPLLYETKFNLNSVNFEYTPNDLWCEDASIQSLVDDFALVNSVWNKTPSEMKHLLDRWHLVNYVILSPLFIVEGLTIVQLLECYRNFKGYTNLHLSRKIESFDTLIKGESESGKAKMDKVLIDFFYGVTFENKVSW